MLAVISESFLDGIFLGHGREDTYGESDDLPSASSRLLPYILEVPTTQG